MSFFEWSYWFDPIPYPLHGWKFWAGLAVLIILIACAFAFFYFAKKAAGEVRRRASMRLTPWAGLFAFLWALLFFFRQQGAGYISARVLPLALLVSMAAWLFFIIRHARTRLPEALKRDHARKEFEKYFSRRA